MTTKQTNNRRATSADSTVNVLDILRYLLFYWKWYLLAILVFLGYFYYEYSKAPYIYQQQMSVAIKNPSLEQISMNVSRSARATPRINVTNEILQFKSVELLQRVVDKLNINVSYSIQDKLRRVELYKISPINVKFYNATNRSMDFSVKLVDSKTALVTVQVDAKQKKAFRVPFNQKVLIGNIAMQVSLSPSYNETWNDQVIFVRRVPINVAANMFARGLQVSQTETNSSIINFSLQHVCPFRANDILNELVREYNANSIEDKTLTATNTEQFIKERLEVIEEELGNVEQLLEQEQVMNGGEDIGSTGERHITQSVQYEDATKAITTQMRHFGEKLRWNKYY